jgi:hypothetical protein
MIGVREIRPRRKVHIKGAKRKTNIRRYNAAGIERVTDNVIDSDNRNVILVVMRGYKKIYEVNVKGLTVAL